MSVTDAATEAAPGPKDRLLFLPLGGSGEIGMNLNLYCYGGKWLMVDLGITFADETLPGIDVVVPDTSFIEGFREDLLGLIVTHAHEDHLGAVAYVWPRLRCPVYATGFAAAVLRRKLAEAGLLDQVPLTEFRPGEPMRLGPFKATAIAITHSIPEANALAIETPLGTVLHSGDWKLDPEPLVGPPTDSVALAARGDAGVLALVCDSTNVFNRGTSGSEGEVRASMMELLKGREGRIAVTTFASNVARIETIAAVAAALDRQLVLVGRALWRITEAARANGYLGGMPPVLTERDYGYLPRDKVMLLCTGSQGEPRGAMARIAGGDHPHVTLVPGDLVVFSSKIIPGNERSLYKLHNQLASAGIDVITEKQHLVHVSGHPSRDELAQMYRWVRPQIAIPVHGEARHLVEHAALAAGLQVPQTVVPRNGDLLQLAPGPVKLVDTVPSGRLAVDVDGSLVPLAGRMLQQRRRMMYNGTVHVTLVVGPEGELLAPPALAMNGLAEAEAGPDLPAALGEAVETGLRQLSRAMRRDEAEVAEAARRAARRWAKAKFSRRPVTDVQVIRLPAATARGEEEVKV